MSNAAAVPWWEGATIYQAYLPSFARREDPEWRALNAARASLDYLNDGSTSSLGIDAIYMSPFYPSSGYDGAYDVEDHMSVAPWAGTEADFVRFLDEAHARGVRVVLDFVANHTSFRHPWFQRSRRHGPYRHWYTWRPAREGGPPNNWPSVFSPVGSAWTLCKFTNEYYLHSFFPQQPDLDWANREVRAAMLRIMQVWLDRGVDGFRIDAAHRLGKDPAFQDNPPLSFDERGYAARRDEDWPVVLEYLAEMRVLADSYGALLVGETYVLNSERVARYAVDGRALHLAHDFALIRQEWNARAIGTVVREIEAAYGARGMPAWLLGNHDHSRLVTRLGGDIVGQQRAKVAAMMLLTLRGTAFVYQGEEAGLFDRTVPAEGLRDVLGRERYRYPAPPGGLLDEHGIANAELGVPDHEVLTEFYDLYRSLIWLRKTRTSLRRGRWSDLSSKNNAIFAFERTHRDERSLVALNFASTAQPARLAIQGEVVLLRSTSDRPSARMAAQDLVLGPNEGVVMSLQ